MEKFKLVGIRPYAFTDDAGVNHSGYSLHCIGHNEYICGWESKHFSIAKEFITKEMYDFLYVELCKDEVACIDITVGFNSRGKANYLSID